MLESEKSFMSFMNDTLATNVLGRDDMYPTMDMSSNPGYKNAADAILKVLGKMSAQQKTQLISMGDDDNIGWELAKIAQRNGADALEEDFMEVVSLMGEYIGHPEIQTWTALVQYSLKK